ncbi:FAD-dependent oxidoreductase [Marinobacterium aestuarii]|uniref:FAD-dependent oxidoreductase n=1 Tax=Marinobacterium aestuarii TaxID=1821621 RepID=A0A1A9EZ55_9GAMM|nr:FAD-dependent oxidoreductase [Marinobacterium aestuarii]ANG62928.1 FAD-dependent oxidoreductase [Marinobacterium aestuarii]
MKHRYEPFWFDQALGLEQQVTVSALRADTTADICIVGGGFTGLWTAIELKQRQPNLDVLLIERDLCGSGASGRNGGCMLTWSTKYLTLKRLFGEAEAKRLVQASEQAVFDIRDFCQKHQIDAQVRIDGTLYTATSHAQCNNMDPVMRALDEAGINSWQTLAPEQVQRQAGSPRHLEGFYSPAAGSLQPAMLVRGLRRVAEQQYAVRIHEQTPLQRLEPGSPIKIQTPGGTVRASKVIMALNGWTPEFVPALRRAIVLVSSDMAITPPMPEQLAQIGLDHGQAVVDSRVFVHYYRTTPDGRLMLGKGGNLFAYGNRMLRAFDEPSRYQRLLRESFDHLFPGLPSPAFVRTWTGPSDRSVTGLPFFDRLPGHDNIFYGLGYSGNGVVQSHIGGHILASLALDADDEWSRSGLAAGPVGFFPPEPVRWLGAMTVRNAVRRKENAEDHCRTPYWWDKRLARLAGAAGKTDKA